MSPVLPPPFLRSDPAHHMGDLRDEEGADEVEWLETDGCGGFASSTASMTPARRYHGLLIAPRPGTARRYLFLAGLLEAWTVGGTTATITRLRLADAPPPAPPDGFEGLDLVPWPRASFRSGAFVLRREVLMPQGRSAVLVRYAIAGPGDEEVELRLEPLLAFREADALTYRNDVLDPHVRRTDQGLVFHPYEALPSMSLAVGGPAAGDWKFSADPRWIAGVTYPTDVARGYDGREDLFSPGGLRVRLRAGEHFTLGARIGEPLAEPDRLFDEEAARRSAATPPGRDLAARVASGADAFCYRDAGGRLGVLAGYPWFGEWGRDTFIALPGLTLARGRLDACREALLGALPYLRDGLLPNIFGRTTEDSHYGSVDASLWFARAVLLYQRAGGDLEVIRQVLAPALEEISEAYREGTAPRVAALGIRADDELLIHAGAPDLNPTWMDAQTSAGPVTPRHGHPVEICALWCSLLSHLAELHASGREEAGRAGRAFLDRFWLPDEGYLADVWSPAGPDTSVRPNMVLAASLELSPLGRARRRQILVRAEAELLTPYGLRTLSPAHPDYAPRYGGGPERRDHAYHQGTVWPWLLGFYCEAWLRVDGSAERRERLRGLWQDLGEELERGGLGHLSEVYDGDPPHRRGGTFAQAWSSAEALRALALLDGRPAIEEDETP